MKRILQLGLLAATPCMVTLVSSCGSTEVTCDDNRTCNKDEGGSGGGGNANAGNPNVGGGGRGGSGTAGRSGSGGGAPNGGGSGGNGGTTNGGGSGESGASGAAGSAPCNGACGGAKAVCDEASNSCVECIDKSQCAAPKPACDAAKNACVECTENPDCKDSAKPFCRKTDEQCVACLQQSDCKDSTASACNAGQCKPCTMDAECSNISGKGVCDAGTCVQCTGKKFTACGSSMGTPLVCDSLKRTCSPSKQASAGLCQPCVSDAQCAASEMCVLDKFGTPSKDVGYFCHWKQGDTADGAPADCPTQGRPYLGVQKNATSIDGTASDICTLRSSTCVARSQFSSKNCANPTLPDDSLCGVAPPKDAKCATFGVGFRCTMTCGSDDDCPAPFTCNTGVSPAVCNLN